MYIRALKEIRCPKCGSLIGKYDTRLGIVNAIFYCRKCKMEYAYTIAAKLDKQKIV